MSSYDYDDAEPPLALWIALLIVTCSSLLLGTGIWSFFEMFMSQPEKTTLTQPLSE
ncbi:MAG: hypothetical protein QNJ46_16645 [Leptolyngbyaceae cyanobacterium MO_188.B28]|nr:hypothetical protein [Leptolyngbyaceae cyanobacterium MO_188.B28]